MLNCHTDSGTCFLTVNYVCNLLFCGNQYVLDVFVWSSEGILLAPTLNTLPLLYCIEISSSCVNWANWLSDIEMWNWSDLVCFCCINYVGVDLFGVDLSINRCDYFICEVKRRLNSYSLPVLDAFRLPFHLRSPRALQFAMDMSVLTINYEQVTAVFSSYYKLNYANRVRL